VVELGRQKVLLDPRSRRGGASWWLSESEYGATHCAGRWSSKKAQAAEWLEGIDDLAPGSFDLLTVAVLFPA
jgi:hypothetical protein